MKTNGQNGEGEPLLYEEVAARIGGMIRNGTYRPGERIPSIRALCRQLRISANTVMESYARLENSGLIEARPQSGFYVCSRLAEPAVLQEPLEKWKDFTPNPATIGDASLEVMCAIANPSLVPLGSGIPNCDLLPGNKLNRMLSSESRRFSLQSIAYPPAQGHKLLRTQIARRSLDSGCPLGPDDIVITSGCVEATNLALQSVCSPGDTVAIGSPVYPTFLKSIQWMGLKVLEIPSTSQGMNLDVLDYAIRHNKISACITIANFNNPLGSLMPDNRKRELVSLLTKHDIPLIEDDVYGDLAYSSSRPVSTKAFDENGLVLYCSSFSKTLAPGYRVGWIAPGRFREKVLRLKMLLNIATTSPTQLAIAEFLTNGGYDHHLRKIRRIYARQTALVRDMVLHHFPLGTQVSRPEGGYILWVELPEGYDAFKLYEAALRVGIAIAPGTIFTLCERYKNCFRLNAALWSERIEQALVTLGGLAK
ncbi:MAG: PLP-dependent aminotransferase family protein [Geobacteraceae bacterium]|nr:PLP-dependent aminotransferase family protein [Geobacteraceae bacterium]